MLSLLLLSHNGQAVRSLSDKSGQKVHLTLSLAVMPTASLYTQAVGQVDEDGSRWLLGDHTGTLSLLVLSHDGQAVRGLSLERLGTISAPSTLTYLDNGVIHVGSCSGACLQ